MLAKHQLSKISATGEGQVDMNNPTFELFRIHLYWILEDISGSCILSLINDL